MCTIKKVADYWIKAYAPNYDFEGRRWGRILAEQLNMPEIVKSGKWLIYFRREDFDKVWTLIKEHTERR